MAATRSPGLGLQRSPALLQKAGNKLAWHRSISWRQRASARCPEPSRRISLKSLERAAVAAGHVATDDLNGERNDGISRMELTIRGGRRASSATAYLTPVLNRSNLTVLTNALFHKVLIERGRSVGVAFARDGEVHVAHAEREVILSGGAFGSPQMLMLSGIGSADELACFDIPVRANLPAVGQNWPSNMPSPRFLSQRQIRTRFCGTCASIGHCLPWCSGSRSAKERLRPMASAPTSMSARGPNRTA